MKTIYKYLLEVTDKQTVKLPEGAIILNVLNQNGLPILYAEVDNEELRRKEVEIAIVGTGHPIEEILDYEYITSVSFEDGKLIWHFYYK